MIDFKYYVVAVTAIFAALIFGLIIGVSLSTNEAVKKQQDLIIKGIREDLNKLRGEIEEKETENETLKKYLTDSKKWLIQERMAGKNIAIIHSENSLNKLKEVVDVLKDTGANTVEISINTDYFEATETTVLSAFISELSSEQIDLNMLSEKYSDMAEINRRDLKRIDYITVVLDDKLTKIFEADSGIKNVRKIVYIVERIDTAYELSKNFASESAVCVFDGDAFDDIALVLSYDAKPGICGEDEKGALIIPEVAR